MMNESYRKDRVAESLGLVYKCHYPFKTKTTGRGVKFTPFYNVLKENGAYFRDVSGWECADWFLTDPLTSSKKETKLIKLGENETFQRPAWFKYWRGEHLACRNGVMLLDMSFMSKFMIEGADAGIALNYLSTADVNGDSGRITYTQWLNEKGTLEADVTITKLSETKFLVIATDTMHRHVHTWLNRNLRRKTSSAITITDVTGGMAQLNVQGPLSRDFMELLCRNDKQEEENNEDHFSNEKFAFRDVKEIEVGYAKVLCARITYVGELGYELYIPTEQAMHVYEKVMDIKERYGDTFIRLGGLKALASLRLEKGYRDYGHDMDNTDTLVEMGLGFTADLNKNGGFIGKDVVVQQKQELKEKKGLHKRLVHVFIGEDKLGSKPKQVMLYHGETLFREGKCVGDIRAGSYAHYLNGLIGLGHISLAPDENVRVNKEFLTTGKWEVEISGKRYEAELSLQPFYDPKNVRIKG